MNIIAKPMIFDPEIIKYISLFESRREYLISYIRGANENLWLTIYPPNKDNVELVQLWRYRLIAAKARRRICDQYINKLKPYRFFQKQKDDKLIKEVKIILEMVGVSIENE